MNPAPMPLISALYTGIFALLLVALALLVSRRRRSMGIGLGAGGDAQLERAIRVHANAVEWGLPVLLLLLIAVVVLSIAIGVPCAYSEPNWVSPVSACASKWISETRPQPTCRAVPVASGSVMVMPS